MNVITWIQVIMGSLLVLLVILLLLQFYIKQKMNTANYKEQQRLRSLLPQQKKKKWSTIGIRAYPYLHKIVILRALLTKVKKRFEILYPGEEKEIRRLSANVTMMVITIVLFIVGIAFMWTEAWTTRIMMMLAGLYIGSFFIDVFVKNVEKKLLQALSDFIMDVRHEYHQTHMVQESLERAADRAKAIIAPHARKIASLLYALDPEDELRQYYDVAPNRYLKQIAGISHIIAEFGDKDGESQYLKALSNIREEIHLDLNRRTKLDQKLSGLIFIAIVPLFMLEPLQHWSESQFPVVSDYYRSKWGVYSLFLLYVIFTITFFWLRALKGFDDHAYKVKTEGKWLTQVRKNRWINQIVLRVTPHFHKSSYMKAKQLLKENNSHLSIENLYFQKILCALSMFILVICMQFTAHYQVKDNIIHPNKNMIIYQHPAGAVIGEEQYRFESTLLGEIVSKNLSPEEAGSVILERVEDYPYIPKDLTRDEYVEALVTKVENHNKEYYKWYELLIAITVAVASFKLPNVYLWFRKRMQKWEMQNEVDSFTNIVMMLSKIDRISVYDLLEWLQRYSYIFEYPLLRCLLDYESGAWHALQKLKEEVKFTSMQQLIDRLQVAADLVPVREAFDDIEQERSFAIDQRKLHYEKMVSDRTHLGQLIGFIPLHATFILYLLIPFVYLAMEQLGDMTSITNQL
ncbi:hypothetical protein [Longirhabdus pacifica]|uniref:hypothetical protein n=1 Tax=Longirhabdus pacifica TaxID=2305227 RepID=UPI0010092466|nr:hypothetical protein [Longirhabdus pacifica]